MKFADRLLYTMWIMWLVIFFVALPAWDERLGVAVWSVGGMWLFCFASGGLAGLVMFESPRKHKHQNLERFRVNKRFMTKLLNVWCLFVWTISANLFYLTDWQAIIFTAIAAVFSGYVYWQDIRRFFFNLLDRVFPDEKTTNHENIGLFDTNDMDRAFTAGFNSSLTGDLVFDDEPIADAVARLQQRNR